MGHRVAAPDRQAVAGRQLQRLLEDRARLRDIAEREVLLDRVRIDVARQPAMGQQGLQFGPEEQVAVVQQREVHRLDAQAVARHEEGLAVAVPQRKGEHAAQSLHAVFAPGLPGVHDDFGVALGVEHMAQRLQLRNQRLEVVDLAVEDDDHRPVFVEQGLLPGGHVDDRQAPMPEPHAGFEVQAAFVRPPVGLRLVHAVQDRMRHGARRTRVEDAGDATHGSQCSCFAIPAAASMRSYKS